MDKPSSGGNTVARDQWPGLAFSNLALIRTCIAVVSGVSLGIAFMTDVRPAVDEFFMRVGIGVAMMLVVMAGWSRSAGWVARSLRFSPEQTSRFFRNDTIAATTTLLMVFFPLGGRFAAPQVACLVLVMIAARAAALSITLAQRQRDVLFTSNGWLAFLFLVSGFAALIYQIVWERALFAAFGVNIESITIIVSLFMFGLGIGSLLGGVIARRFAGRAPTLFLVCELCIGAFGLVSLPLIDFVARMTLHAPLPVVSAAIFALLCIPTLFMGATLPILVTHLYLHYRNLGQSVGILYAINTIGSALACFITADLLFVFGGEHAAVIVAAACNFAVGILISRYAWNTLQRTNPASFSTSPPVASVEKPRQNSLWFLILFFAAATGYVSLSQEIVWMRLIGYITGGMPTVFAHVLGCFLIGVAGGALLGEKWCSRHFTAGDSRPMQIIGIMLLASAGFYYLSTAGLAELAVRHPAIAPNAIYAIVIMTSLLLGGIFTILCHFGARAGEAVGVTVSRIYLANIVGCTLGPIVTGFVLMQFMPIDRIILYLGAGTAMLGGIALLHRTTRKIAGPVVAAVGIAGMFLLQPLAYRDFLAKLQFANAYRPNPYSAVVETRSGIITVRSNSAGGDEIYGGGKYDGRFNIDPVIDSNAISRCYMIAALHPSPAEVLEVGLSGGSWARVMADYAPIRHLTSVEINSGYIDLLRTHADRYPLQSSILTDPKITITIDDGRRWLKRNPSRKFDLIVQNTTYHWRNEITNLLSIEYLRLCKEHLNPGGVLYLNATSSDDVPFTAAHVFTHIVRINNEIAASDKPFDLSPEQIGANLMRFTQAGNPIFDLSDGQDSAAARGKFFDLTHMPLADIAPEILRRKDLWIITDDNMATEFKRSPADGDSGIDRTRWWDGDRDWMAAFNWR